MGMNDDKPRADWWDKLPDGLVRLLVSKGGRVHVENDHIPLGNWCRYAPACTPIGFRAPEGWKY